MSFFFRAVLFSPFCICLAFHSFLVHLKLFNGNPLHLLIPSGLSGSAARVLYPRPNHERFFKLVLVSNCVASLRSCILLIAAQRLLLTFSWFFFISPSRFLLRPYGVIFNSNLLFLHSFIHFQLNCVRDVIFHY